MSIVKIKIVVVILLLPLLADSAVASVPEQRLEKYLLAEDVQIMRATTETDLSLAHYRDAGPVIILEVGRSARHLFYYTEVNDLGGILLSASLDFSDIKTILQAHSITCQDILAALEGEPIFIAPCLPLR